MKIKDFLCEENWREHPFKGGVYIDFDALSDADKLEFLSGSNYGSVDDDVEYFLKYRKTLGKEESTTDDVKQFVKNDEVLKVIPDEVVDGAIKAARSKNPSRKTSGASETPATYQSKQKNVMFVKEIIPKLNIDQLKYVLNKLKTQVGESLLGEAENSLDKLVSFIRKNGVVDDSISMISDEIAREQKGWAEVKSGIRELDQFGRERLLYIISGKNVGRMAPVKNEEGRKIQELARKISAGGFTNYAVTYIENLGRKSAAGEFVDKWAVKPAKETAKAAQKSFKIASKLSGKSRLSDSVIVEEEGDILSDAAIKEVFIELNNWLKQQNATLTTQQESVKLWADGMSSLSKKDKVKMVTEMISIMSRHDSYGWKKIRSVVESFITCPVYHVNESVNGQLVSGRVYKVCEYLLKESGLSWTDFVTRPVRCGNNVKFKPIVLVKTTL